ncbi:MAG: hypothetical protein WKF81_09520 [Thermomicrobiales bacterium]
MDEQLIDSGPTIARIWKGRTRRSAADEYEMYNFEVGIRPLQAKALGVQTLREDRDSETEFTTISYWASLESMASFTDADPTAVHHLERDTEFLIELPERVEICQIRTRHGELGQAT